MLGAPVEKSGQTIIMSLLMDIFDNDGTADLIISINICNVAISPIVLPFSSVIFIRD